MSSEALRLADELPSIDNLKRIAASDSPTAIQNGLVNAIKWIQSLERELKFERAASFRDQIASLEAERDQLRAELETERMRLAACGVIATSNTPESAVANRVMLPEFWSASAQDVASAVDREMALRAEVERLREFFDADMAVAKIYDEVSPGLTSPKGAEWSDRVEAAIARRCAAVIAIEAAKEAK